MKKQLSYIFCMSLLINYFSGEAQEPYEKRSNPDNYQVPVMKAIAYGLTAPSPHNSQSWYIDTLSGNEMLLYVKHLLPETDPPARQIHMGAGCFIELAAIGMSHEGYDTRVEYFPDGEYSLQPFELAARPVARITLVASDTVSEDPLYGFIWQRGTNRKPYKGKMISREEFRTIENLTNPTGSKLTFINARESMRPYQDIFSEAMEIETRTHSTNEETRRMFRFSEAERASRKDGISIPQMGYDGMIRNVAEKSLRQGDSVTWHSEKTLKATMKGINKGIYSAKGIILFTTPSNTPLDWVESGRDYARYNIAIAKLGIVTHPYNQVIQEYPEMEALQQKFNRLAGIEGDEKVQMIVRVGRAKSSYKSWRKKPEDYLLQN